MKIRESFKADRYGFLDRSGSRDERLSMDHFDKSTIFRAPLLAKSPASVA